MRCHETIAIRAIALLHIALTRILHNEAVRWISTVPHIATILTHTVREASHTCALVCMEGHTRLDTRLSACGTVLTRAAVALVHVNVTVASWPLSARLKVVHNCPTIVVALTDSTLAGVLADETIVTQAVCIAFIACARVCVERYSLVVTRVRTSSEILTRR